MSVLCKESVRTVRAVNVLRLSYAKPISLMPYKVKVAACSEIRTQHINAM